MIDPSASIDSRAVVDPSAEVGARVEVGPFSVIGADVEIGADCWIGPHVVLNGPTRIGPGNKIFQFSSIGEAPQDKKYDDEPTRLEIGAGNVFREYCTVSRGTAHGLGLTRIGDHNWIMAYTHIAHDCVVADRTVFANGTSLAGHVEVQEQAILGGFTLVHQFCRVGAHSFCSMGSAIRRDVPPYFTVAGDPVAPHGINSVGLRRSGFTEDAIAAIRRAYRFLYRSSLLLDEALERIDALGADHREAKLLAEFIRASGRGIVR